MGKQTRGVLVGLLMVAGGCGGGGEPTHVGTDVLSGPRANYAVVAVGPDGTTYFGETFSGTIDIDPLGAGDVRAGMGDGAATLLWRTRADGTREWVRTLDGNESSAMSTSWRASDGAVFIAGAASVTKLDPAGEPVWTAPCAGWGCTSPYGVPSAAATADGGIVFLGWDKSLVRLAGDGSVRWVSTAAQLGPACTDLAIPKVLEAPDGSLLIGGDTLTPCTGTSASWPWGMFILRLDAGGNLVASRTVVNMDDNSAAFLQDMAVGPDGSVFAAGNIQGTVDFDSGPGQAVRSVGPGAAGFAMKMRPDFSLIAAAKTSANQNFLNLIAVAPSGQLVGIEHHDSQRFGGVSDPYLVTLDGSLRQTSSVRLAGALTYVNGLAVGGNVIAVVGIGPANEYIPGASAELGADSLFLARYRF